MSLFYYICLQKKYFMKYIILFLLVSSSLFAQSDNQFDFNNSSTTSGINDEVKMNGAWIVSKPVKSQIEGSVYLFPTWSGNFVMQSKSGSRFTLDNLNYNIKTKELETKFSRDSVFQFNKNDLNFVYYNSKTYKLFNGELLQVLNVDGNYNFFKKFDVSVVDGVLNPLTQVTSPSFYKTKEEYLYLNGTSLETLKLKKKFILKIFSDKEKEIKAFVSDEKLSYSNEDDVVKIFKFYFSK